MDNGVRMDLNAPLHPVLGIAFVNFIFVLILLIIFFSFFATPAGFEIKLPSVGANEMEGAGHITILITGENVLYFNDKVVTINDLKRDLAKMKRSRAVIELNIDRRSSMGRVWDVWEMCKGLGVAKIKIITH